MKTQRKYRISVTNIETKQTVIAVITASSEDRAMEALLKKLPEPKENYTFKQN